MIGKVKIGKSFPGICRYVFREDKGAKVLGASGVRTDSAEHMAQDFQFQQQMRRGLGNAVLHVALALPAEDATGRSPAQLSELFRKIGQAYVQEMKLTNTQWALVQHFDKAHPHAHLLANRVDNDGRTIADNFIGQESRQVCQRLEHALDLTVAEQRGREQAREVGKTHRQATAKTPRQERAADWQRARHEVANALRHTAPYAGSFAELKEKLAPRGVELRVSTYEKPNGQARYGVTFEKSGYRFKGSDVAKQYGAAQLLHTFARCQAQAPSFAEAAKRVAQAFTAGRANQLPAQREAEQQKPEIPSAGSPAAAQPSTRSPNRSRDTEIEW